MSLKDGEERLIEELREHFGRVSTQDVLEKADELLSFARSVEDHDFFRGYNSLESLISEENGWFL
ncbi:MAG: hypothetical protein AABY10_04010 [Nanoarchaeota archaeon]